MKTQICLALTLIGFCSAALGQESMSQFPQPVQSPPIAYRHASTLQEGIRRGQADLVRAMGEFNYNTASAALIFEHARKEAYANELRHAETFWAKRSLWHSQMAAEKARRSPVRHSVQPEIAPVKLQQPVVGIDPSQPGFQFPAAFDHPAFTASRQRLVELFSERSPQNSGTSSTAYLRILNTTSEMRSLLSGLVRDLPPMAYVDARNFLDLVDHEAAQLVRLKVAAN